MTDLRRPAQPSQSEAELLSVAGKSDTLSNRSPLALLPTSGHVVPEGVRQCPNAGEGYDYRQRLLKHIRPS